MLNYFDANCLNNDAIYLIKILKGIMTDKVYNYRRADAALTWRNAIPDIETFIMRQRKNNGRLSRFREPLSPRKQKDKGIRFFGGNGNGIPISSRGVSSLATRDAISHLPSTCSPSSLAFSVLPRLPDQGCRRSGSAVLTPGRVPGARFLGALTTRSSILA